MPSNLLETPTISLVTSITRTRSRPKHLFFVDQFHDNNDGGTVVWVFVRESDKLTTEKTRMVLIMDRYVVKGFKSELTVSD